MTGAVLYYQRATFGDLAESARFLLEVGKGARVLSDETYGRHANNVKMRFWSGREDILPLHETEPKEGDILVLHNTYSKISSEYEWLEENFEYAVLARWGPVTHPGQFITIPLLPDIMADLDDPVCSFLTSNPPCMMFRFRPQIFYSVVLRLTSDKNAQEKG